MKIAAGFTGAGRPAGAIEVAAGDCREQDDVRAPASMRARPRLTRKPPCATDNHGERRMFLQFVKRLTHRLAISAFALLEVLGLPGVGRKRSEHRS